MKTKLTVLITFTVLILFSITLSADTSLASPNVKLCLEKKCKNPYQIKITHATWTDVKAIFSEPFSTDKDEQDNILNAISLIEYDIYHTLANQLAQSPGANDLYVNNSSKNDYRNIKNILSVLLDNYLVKRHLMRRTIKLTSWTGAESSALLLQALGNAKLYILESQATKLGNSAVISDYKKNSGFVKHDGKATNNSLDDDDFE